MIELNEQDLDRKLKAAEVYSELRQELAAALDKYGRLTFKKEWLFPVASPHSIKAWDTSPYYEIYGQRKKSAGQYQEVISFHKHLLPLAKHIRHYSSQIE